MWLWCSSKLIFKNIPNSVMMFKKIWIWCSNLTFQMELMIRQINESNVKNIILMPIETAESIQTQLWCPKYWIEYFRDSDVQKLWTEQVQWCLKYWINAWMDCSVIPQNTDSNVPKHLWSLMPKTVNQTFETMIQNTEFNVSNMSVMP